MIGTGVAQSLQAAAVNVSVTSRSGLPLERLPGVEVHKFKAKTDSIETVVASLKPGDFVINCIGMVKSLIHDDEPESCEAAFFLNSEFPSKLAAVAEAKGLKNASKVLAEFRAEIAKLEK